MRVKRKKKKIFDFLRETLDLCFAAAAGRKPTEPNSLSDLRTVWTLMGTRTNREGRFHRMESLAAAPTTLFGTFTKDSGAVRHTKTTAPRGVRLRFERNVALHDCIKINSSGKERFSLIVLPKYLPSKTKTTLVFSPVCIFW